MNILATIGKQDESINYTDRPTVKVVVREGDTILLFNEGLLPGGGVDEGESHNEAIARELQEELGATVSNCQQVGTVIQYRDLLNKKYVVRGYTADLTSIGGPTNPQDEREAQLILHWLSLPDAKEYVARSIESAKSKPMSDDDNQGKLFNLMTTYEFLKTLN